MHIWTQTQQKDFNSNSHQSFSKKDKIFLTIYLTFFLKIGKWVQTCSGSGCFQFCLISSSVFGFDIFDSSPTFQSSTQH